MPLETITYVSDLNTANPVVSDGLVQGDDHLRGIKTALKNTFPNFTGAALQSSQAQLDAVAHTQQFSAQDGVAGAPSITFVADLTAGFRRGARTGQTLIEGTLRGAGAVPPGALMDFPVAPVGLGTTWLECDGTIYNITSFPDLGAFLGSSFGGDGTTTFGVPNLKDTGRFRRSRSATLGAGSYQANVLGSHTHTGTTVGAGLHSHTATVADPGHAHNYNHVQSNTLANPSAGSSSADAGNQGTYTTTSATTGITVSIASDGLHTHPFTTDPAGTTETRPEAFVVYACIKT